MSDSETKDKYQVDIETATDDFNRFTDAWEIDVEESGLNNEEKIDIKKLKRQIIKAIQLGRLCYNQEDDSIQYTFSDKSQVTEANKTISIRRPKGSAYLSIDQFKDNQDTHKMYNILAMMSGKPIQFFANIDGIDLKPLQAIMTLFLAE
jgi:hypothetical protein